MRAEDGRLDPRRRGLAVALFASAVLAASSACSRGDETEAARASTSAGPPARVREMADEVVALRRMLDLGRLDDAQPLLAAWRAKLGLEGELLAARAATLAGDSSEASRCIEAARALDATDARVYATAAELHAAAGRLETAGAEIRRGVDAAGATPELLRAQGVLFLCQPRGAARGLELIESALSRDRTLPFVDRALGQAHLLVGKEALSQKRLAEALDHARRSLEHDPADVDARRFFADALLEAQDIAAAVEVLQELVDEGEPLQAELGLQCKRAAMLDLIRHRQESALEYFLRARTLGLTDDELGTGARLLREAAAAAVAEGVAAYAAQEQDLERARERFERALALDPDSLEAHNHLGVVLFRTREFDRAAAEWARVLEVALEEGIELPEPVHLNLAKALVRAGRADEARKAVEEYLALEPEGMWATESREALRMLDESR